MLTMFKKVNYIKSLVTYCNTYGASYGRCALKVVTVCSKVLLTT